MMRDGFWLGRRALKSSRQGVGGAAMQRLSSAFQQAFVGRVLDQRMLEAVI